MLSSFETILFYLDEQVVVVPVVPVVTKFGLVVPQVIFMSRGSGTGSVIRRDCAPPHVPNITRISVQ
jgi:hypothetical protein